MGCRFWKSEVAFLPWPCRAMAAACLQSQPCRRPTAAELLDCDFFPQSVRSAAFFLAALHPARPTLRQTWDPSHASLSPPAKAMSVMDKAPWLLGMPPPPSRCHLHAQELHICTVIRKSCQATCQTQLDVKMLGLSDNDSLGDPQSKLSFVL